MTAPRQVLPGSTYFITRRTAYRQFLLRPDAQTKQTFDFCLAYAAKRHKMKLIAWEAMSNHYHAVVHDADGEVCRFIQYFHRLLAAVLNAKWKRRENLWSVEETCITLLATEQDVVAKVAYVLANPASAHLVEKAREWPGASSLAYLDGEARTIERPPFYFKEEGSAVPEEVNLRAVLPPGTKLTRAVFVKEVMKQVAALEAKAAQKRRASRKLRVVGVQALLAAPPTSAPRTEHRASKLRPRLACFDKSLRIELLLAEKQFRLHHRDARLELLEGVARPMFPRGTLSRSGYPPLLTGDRAPHASHVLQRHLTRAS